MFFTGAEHKHEHGHLHNLPVPIHANRRSDEYMLYQAQFYSHGPERHH